MENLVLTLNLSVAQINVILKYLGSGAFAEVESVINSIREQAAPQLQAAATPAEQPADASVN